MQDLGDVWKWYWNSLISVSHLPKKGYLHSRRAKDEDSPRTRIKPTLNTVRPLKLCPASKFMLHLLTVQIKSLKFLPNHSPVSTATCPWQTPRRRVFCPCHIPQQKGSLQRPGETNKQTKNTTTEYFLISLLFPQTKPFQTLVLRKCRRSDLDNMKAILYLKTFHSIPATHSRNGPCRLQRKQWPSDLKTIPNGLRFFFKQIQISILYIFYIYNI